MMRIIHALRKIPPARMTVDGHEVYTELNVSMIEGGTAINIVPAKCKITCERRVLPDEKWDDVKHQVDKALSTVKGIDFKVHFYKPQKSYLLKREQPLVTWAKESAAESLGYEPKLRAESGRTDSIYFDQMASIKTIIFGPGENAHIPDEYIDVRRLEEFSRVLLNMLSRNS
jgi:acetylornithine deacetylase/succinyl-diaminopimelate desuccinylase-like protein